MKSLIAFNVAFYSFISGLFACFVSISVKLAFNTNLILDLNQHSWLLKVSLQVVFILASLLFNSFMWLFYTKSLNESTNTLYSTALNKFSNFICSALSGYFLFEENINFTRWFFGLTILLIGIIILNDSTTTATTTELKETKKQK
jgi:drug/metabolite transporter (DMT)-like permease